MVPSPVHRLKIAAVFAAAVLWACGDSSTSECPLWDCPGPVPPPPPATYAVYVANDVGGTGSVSGYRVDNSTGALTEVPGSPFAAGANPSAVRGDGFVYVANSGSSSISGYESDRTTRALRALSSSPYPTGAGTVPRDIASSEHANYVVSSSTDSVLVFPKATSAPFGGLVGPNATLATGALPVAIAVHPTARAAYVANSASNDISVYSIDETTGALAVLGQRVPAGTGPQSMALDASRGLLYVANFGSSDVSAYRVDSTSGVLTSLGTTPAGAGPSGVVVHPLGRFVYVANRNSNDISCYRVDVTTGALTSLGAAVAAGTSPRGLAIEPQGRFLYSANAGSGDVSAYRIDSRTGVLTSIGARVAAGANPSAIASF